MHNVIDHYLHYNKDIKYENKSEASPPSSSSPLNSDENKSKTSSVGITKIIDGGKITGTMDKKTYDEKVRINDLQKVNHMNCLIYQSLPLLFLVILFLIYYFPVIAYIYLIISICITLYYIKTCW